MGEGRVGGACQGKPRLVNILTAACPWESYISERYAFLSFFFLILAHHPPAPTATHTHTHTHTPRTESRETILIHDLLALCSLDIRVQAAAPMTAVHSTCLLETPGTLYALIVLGWLSWWCQPLGDFNHVKLLLSLMECLSPSLCSCLSPLLIGLHVA